MITSSTIGAAAGTTAVLAGAATATTAASGAGASASIIAGAGGSSTSSSASLSVMGNKPGGMQTMANVMFQAQRLSMLSATAVNHSEVAETTSDSLAWTTGSFGYFYPNEAESAGTDVGDIRRRRLFVSTTAGSLHKDVSALYDTLLSAGMLLFAVTAVQIAALSYYATKLHSYLAAARRHLFDQDREYAVWVDNELDEKIEKAVMNEGVIKLPPGEPQFKALPRSFAFPNPQILVFCFFGIGIAFRGAKVSTAPGVEWYERLCGILSACTSLGVLAHQIYGIWRVARMQEDEAQLVWANSDTPENGLVERNPLMYILNDLRRFAGKRPLPIWKGCVVKPVADDKEPARTMRLLKSSWRFPSHQGDSLDRLQIWFFFGRFDTFSGMLCDIMPMFTGTVQGIVLGLFAHATPGSAAAYVQLTLNLTLQLAMLWYLLRCNPCADRVRNLGMQLTQLLQVSLFVVQLAGEIASAINEDAGEFTYYLGMGTVSIPMVVEMYRLGGDTIVNLCNQDFGNARNFFIYFFTKFQAFVSTFFGLDIISETAEAAGRETMAVKEAVIISGYTAALSSEGGAAESESDPPEEMKKMRDEKDTQTHQDATQTHQNAIEKALLWKAKSIKKMETGGETRRLSISGLMRALSTKSADEGGSAGAGGGSEEPTQDQSNWGAVVA